MFVFKVPVGSHGGDSQSVDQYRGPPKHWKDIQQLGRGGSAEVWLCHDIDANNFPLARKKIWIKLVSF